ncbi:MAG: single-stranded DNA-binding protein [Oscillospiraceae bacterium]|nr:single-stranded DNA-binding protein [Oscillospiraceae bacterium]
MDMIYEKNHIKLCGSLAAPPVYSHSARGRIFYSFPLEVRRLSGSTDTVNVVLGSEQLKELDISDCGKLCVEGQLRTWNNRRGEGAKLVITVLARELYFCDGPDENLVRLSGTLCKAPNLRITPMGRDICDLMLAVNRHYGRSDYLPCICWGMKARQAANWQVGTSLRLEGRLQSRSYIKLTEEGASQRVAFEVSVTEIEELLSAEKSSI